MKLTSSVANPILAALLLAATLGGCDGAFLRRTADDSNLGTDSNFRFNDVEIQGFGPQIMDGYLTCDDLLSDITVALKVLANKNIKDRKKMNCTYFDDDYYQNDDDIGFANNMGDSFEAMPSMSKGDRPSGGVSSFETNNQVEGVDEADAVKANEDYVYLAYGNELVVTDTIGQVLVRVEIPQPPKLAEDDSNFYYQEERQIKGLLLDGTILTVVTEFYNSTSFSTLVGGSSTTIFLYEFEESELDSTLTLKQQIDINGSYSNARMINGNNHIVTTANMYTYEFTKGFARCDDDFRGLSDDEYEEEAFRIANDTVDAYAQEIMEGLNLMQETENDKSCKDIVQIFQQHKNVPKYTNDMWFLYNPEDILNSFVQILSFDGSGVLEGKDVKLKRAGTFLPTSSTQMYAANELLALAGQGYRNENVTNLNEETTGQVASEYTFVITFDLDSQATPAAAGEVEGSSQDQFNMDFFEGHLRIATSSGTRYGLFPLKDGHREWTMLDDSKSRISVLLEQEGELVTVGIVDDLGVGDMLKSVRLLGERGYISSWDEDTPLYVLDLSEPTNPVKDGELNITDGHLNYIHPLESGKKLLAVGTATADKNSYESIGLYISLLNVVDPANPYEEQAFVFETNGGSQALNNHHAFRFIPEINKLIIPGYTYDWQKKDFFDGTWLFEIDAVNGISHAGSVKHAGIDEMTNWHCWAPKYLPSRSMVFNDTLMTMQSHSIVVTDDVNTLSEQVWDINLDEGRDEIKYDDCTTYGYSYSWY